MIRVLYDQIGFSETHGGVSRLFAEVMRNLPQGIEWQLGLVCSNNVYLQNPPFSLPPPKCTLRDFIQNTLHGHCFAGVRHVYRMLARMMPGKFPSGELANERAFQELCRRGDFDILHLTTAHPNLDNWSSIVGKKPIVATVVDLIPDMLYHAKRVMRFRSKLLTDASHIIAISENTKRDLMRLYQVAEDKISVIYLGYNASQGDAEVADAILAHFGLTKKKYFLYVGKRNGYKNFDWMVKAIAPILKDGIRLFCTGTPFNAEELAIFDQLRIRDNVVQSFVSDAEMSALFRNAAAFVHPSLYEGFGIPLLDAFASSCPALVSNASCLPEIGGDAALYFDPHDSDDLCRKAAEILNDGGLRETLVQRGGERVKLFSWTKCASATADVYRKLCG